MHQRIHSQWSRILSFLIVPAMIVSSLWLTPIRRAAAIGEASTLFGVFVPVSSNSERVASLVVTAISDSTVVDIQDATNDSGSDESSHGVTLDTGQSYITYVRGGALGGGRTQAGDFFIVRATKQVVVANETFYSDWQHTFVPSDNHRGTGTSFYLYRQPGLTSASTTNDLLNVFAYNDDTTVHVIDITRGQGVSVGKTQVVSDALGTLVLSTVLQSGQDLLEVNQKHTPLAEGHTYHIISSNDVSVQYGSLAKGLSGSRDGGSYVPGKTGFSADTIFYFTLPYEHTTEREMRIISYDNPADVTVRGWNTATRSFTTIAQTTLPAFGHLELVGNALGSYTANRVSYGYYFFEVTSSALVSVFETNWLETGSYGTSDIATFISSKEGTGAGTYFQTYMGPPSNHPYTTTRLSHLVISTYQTATVQVADSDSYGEYIELYNNSSHPVDLSGWTLTNSMSQTIVISGQASIPAGGTYLLAYHSAGTSVTPDYVYGDASSEFRLGNAADSIALSDAGGNLQDSMTYTDTGWLSHGIYHALERINPNLPFNATNARDSTVYAAASANNLGDYYGSPKVHNGQPGLLTGTVVINEFMAGRIYRKFTIDPNSYYDFSLTSAEWEGLHNGNLPSTTSNATHPENPYLIVRSDVPISVMNSNWNDNWMSYATGVLRPDPEVTLLLDNEHYRPGETVQLTALGTNYYGDLYHPVLRVNLPPEIHYAPGNYSATGQLSTVTPDQALQPNGSWVLTWVLSNTMSTGIANRVSVIITGSVALSATDGTLLPAVATLTGTDNADQPYSSQDTAVADVSIDANGPAASDILINEVMPTPDCASDEWIELYNRGTSNLPLGGYELTNRNGLVYRFSSSVPDLARNAYLVVHLSAGQDITTSSPMQLYAGATLAGALDDAQDQVALFKNGLRTATSLADFMHWGTPGLTDPRGDLDLAIASGQWVTSTAVTPPTAGSSLNRRINGAIVLDTNTSADWVTGTATPGQLNNPSLVKSTPSSVQNLKATPVLNRAGGLQLSWTNPVTNLDQITLVRSAVTYPVHLSDGVVVYTGTANSFLDVLDDATTTLYYSAFASHGSNIACTTNGSQARALPTQHTLLAYEDTKGAGWSDWDTNDLVVAQDTALTLNRDGISRIEAFMTAEARGAAYDHALTLTLPISGNALMSIERYDQNGNRTSISQSTVSGVVNAAMFTSTMLALPANPGTFTSNTYSGTHKIAGLSARVVITPLNPAANSLETTGLPPFDPWIHVIDTGDNIHLMQAGSVGNSQLDWDSNSPLYGRDLPLALNLNEDWAWPLETHPIWKAYPRYSTYITSAGALNTDWFRFPIAPELWASYSATLRLADNAVSPAQPAHMTTSSGWPQTMPGSIFASALMVTLNDTTTLLVGASQDGHVTAWNADGSSRWSQEIGSLLRSSPAAGDINADGRTEIVIGSGDGKLYAWHADDGTLLTSFPISVANTIKSTPALAQLDATPGLEIILQAGDGKIYIYKPDGTLYPGWPISTGGVVSETSNTIIASSPAVGDLDGDGVPEIVAGSTSGRVYTWHADGTPLSVLWPHQTGDWVYGSPVLVDLNQDGYRDVVVASGDGNLYAWRGDGLSLPGFPVRLGQAVVGSPLVTDIDGDGQYEVVVSTLAGKVFALRNDGTPVSGWPYNTGATTYASPVAADIDSDGYPEIIVGNHSGAIVALKHDGTPVSGWPKQTGDWVVSTPAIGDLDNDGLVDVAVGAYNGLMFVWETAGTAHSTAIAWGGFHFDAARSGAIPMTGTQQTLPVWRPYYFPLMYRH
jgi:LruC domain-containing protein